MTVRPVEVRVLEGANLYFPRPAIKVTLDVSPWLGAPGEALARAAGALGAPPMRFGPAGSAQRRTALARLAAAACRAVASAVGTRAAVRGRPGPMPGEIVIAFPWRRLGTATALAEELPAVLAALLEGEEAAGALARAAERVAEAPAGPRPEVPAPRVPVIAVTGTNGKTTTVRMLVHVLRGAGLRVGSTTTDGVYVDDQLVESGDYSGFGGAAMALSQPGVSAAVLETARGGILLRGIGTAHNDVSIVTNVSADHLGMYGIETIDQLAEVKATITRITRREGWCVLNADDPRVLAMRRGARGRPFLFSMHPGHPALREAVAERGRAMTILDGQMTVLGSGMRASPLVPLEEVPVTLGGISTPNAQNAMAAAAGALGIGLSPGVVADGIRSFVPDPERNPGRGNVFELDGVVVILDYAHNEAGMAGLVEICRGLRKPEAAVWLGFGVAGDRSEAIMRGMGEIAARGADHVVICELHRYLRGRDPAWVVEQLRAGALAVGERDVPLFPDEVTGLGWMLERAVPGDVVGLTALGQRPELFAMLDAGGAERLGPDRVRRLAARARLA